MAEAIGLASSIAGLISLTIQVTDGILKLKTFVASYRNAVAILDDVAHDLQTHVLILQRIQRDFYVPMAEAVQTPDSWLGSPPLTQVICLEPTQQDREDATWFWHLLPPKVITYTRDLQAASRIQRERQREDDCRILLSKLVFRMQDDCGIIARALSRRNAPCGRRRDRSLPRCRAHAFYPPEQMSWSAARIHVCAADSRIHIRARELLSADSDTRSCLASGSVDDSIIVSRVDTNMREFKKQFPTLAALRDLPYHAYRPREWQERHWYISCCDLT